MLQLRESGPVYLFEVGNVCEIIMLVVFYVYAGIRFTDMKTYLPELVVQEMDEFPDSD